PANPITRYSAMKSARLLGFATSRHLHHVPGHDPIMERVHPQAARNAFIKAAEEAGVSLLQ
ncbi:DUF982 domain-containing protein, partial [Agrobacterium rhizogenes]